VHLVVIAKEPVAGRVKTRLCPPFSSDQAAALAEAALHDTLASVAQTAAADKTLALDGNPGDWLPAGMRVMPQRGTGLDERLAAAFTDAQRHDGLPVLLIGMDTPQVSAELLTRCAVLLLMPGGPDAVLGPATDGGWWALGLRNARPELLCGVPMSSPETGAAQRQRLTASGLSVGDLPTLTDVDDEASAWEVAAAAPGTRFARTLASLAVTT
jgi:hypothetical protein